MTEAQIKKLVIWILVLLVVVSIGRTLGYSLIQALFPSPNVASIVPF